MTRIPRKYEKRASVPRDHFRAGLIAIVNNSRIRMTVRQIFYAATVAGLVPKDEGGYSAVQEQLVSLRREGLIDYDRIVDNTRRVIQREGYESPSQYLAAVSGGYRADYWLMQPQMVSVFLEKDALSELVSEVTLRYQVPLYVARGYTSVTFIRDAAEALPRDKPSTVLLLGDCDPSGKDAQRDVVEKYRHHRPDADVKFVHVALTQTQMARWGVPTRPTKQSDTRAGKWTGESAELDAVDPDFLQARLEDAIVKRIDAAAWNAAARQEAVDRERIREAIQAIILQ